MMWCPRGLLIILAVASTHAQQDQCVCEGTGNTNADVIVLPANDPLCTPNRAQNRAPRNRSRQKKSRKKRSGRGGGNRAGRTNKNKKGMMQNKREIRMLKRGRSSSSSRSNRKNRRNKRDSNTRTTNNFFPCPPRARSSPVVSPVPSEQPSSAPTQSPVILNERVAPISVSPSPSPLIRSPSPSSSPMEARKISTDVPTSTPVFVFETYAPNFGFRPGVYNEHCYIAAEVDPDGRPFVGDTSGALDSNGCRLGIQDTGFSIWYFFYGTGDPVRIVACTPDVDNTVHVFVSTEVANKACNEELNCIESATNTAQCSADSDNLLIDTEQGVKYFVEILSLNEHLVDIQVGQRQR